MSSGGESEAIMGELAQQVLCFLDQNEGLAKQAPDFLKALPTLQPNYDELLMLAPFLYTEVNDVNCLRSSRKFEDLSTSDPETPEVLLQLESTIDAGGVLEDLGYSCSVDVNRCKEVLTLLLPLNEKDVAVIIGMVSRTHLGLEDIHGAHGTLCSLLCDSASYLADSPCLTTWNLDVLMDAIKQLALNLDWLSVIENLDHEGFFLPDQKAFSILMSLYTKSCREPFPIRAICGGIWKNAEGQLSFLRHAVAAPPEIFTFGSSPRKQVLLEGFHKFVYGSPNHAFLSIDLLEVLCRLAELGHGDAVRSILEDPMKHCPELLLVGLAQVKTDWNLIQTEYCPILFSAYLSNNQNASLVLHQLWFLNREIVIRAMVEIHSKDPSTIARILDMCQDLKVLTMVLDATPFPFAIDLAALASRREYLNLEKWLQDNLAIHRDSLFQACLRFLRERVLVDSLNVVARSGPIGLSLETTALFFKALQSFVGQLSSRDLAEEMKRVHSAAVRCNPRLLSVGATEQSSTEAFASDIEEEANSYFHKIYTNNLTIDSVVEMLERFNASPVQREHEIFSCMIQSLFDEYRFFPRYPERELRITAVLFGKLIKHQLVSSITLGVALRCVLDALRKPPDSRMFSFGMTALEQFTERLVEWPQYCNHILQISHMREGHMELVEFIERALTRVSTGQTDVGGNNAASDHHQNVPVQASTPEHVEADIVQSAITNVAQSLNQQLPPMQLQQQQDRPRTAGGALGFTRSVSQPGHSLSAAGQLYDMLRGQKATQTAQASNQNFPRPSRTTSVPVRQPSSTPGFGHALNIETLVAAAERRDTPMENPSLETEDKVAFIINNISATNFESKAKECLEVVKEQYYPWFAQYMVMKRASIEPNFHDLYLKFLDKMFSKALHKEIVKATYENCKVLLRSELIKSSSEERSLLKNLGSWLGKLTIGRNQVLKAIEIDPKTLIIEAYEKGLMIAVIPFTSKILEPCHSSRVYQPPNPWTMGILSLLAEIYALPNLKMNLKFDIEVLFKNLGVDMKDVKPTQLLKGRIREVEGNPDFSNKDLAASHQPPSTEHTSIISSLNQVEFLPELPVSTSHPTIPLSSSTSQLAVAGHISPSSSQDDERVLPFGGERATPVKGLSTTSTQSPYSSGQASTAFPNLNPYVVLNPKLAGVSQQLQLQLQRNRIVPMAMERAIREIIAPVVDRSVTIACMTTRELIMKDFALEADDSRTLHSANLMVASLAGSLAHVTCKEPLRVAMANHIRSLLQALSVASEILEQAVHLVTNDNLDLGCAVIEKAATEKALRDLEEALAPLLSLRRNQREALIASYSQGNLARLPEALRPKPGRLSPAQQRVFEDFARLPWQNQPTQTSSVTPSGPSPASAAAISSGSAVSRLTYPVGQGGLSVFTGTQTSAAITQALDVSSDELDVRTPSPTSFSDGGGRHQDIPIDVGGSAAFTDAAGSDIGLPGKLTTLSAPTLPVEQLVNVPAEPSLGTGDALENYNLIAQKLEAAVTKASSATYSSLPADHEIRALVLEVQEVIAQCISRDEAALAIAQKVFKRLYENTGSSLHVSAHFAILEAIRDVCKRVVKELTSWVIYSDEERKFNREITVGLFRSELISMNEYNLHLAKLMDGGRNTLATEFAIYIVKTCLAQEAGVSATELYNVIDTLSKMAQRPGSPESLQQLVEIAKNNAVVAKEDKAKLSKDKKLSITRNVGNKDDIKSTARDSASADPVGLREQVVVLFDEWARVYNAPGASDKAYAGYISQLTQSGFLKGDDVTDRFFRILTELAVAHCLPTDSPLVTVPQQPQTHNLSFAAIDMYAKLVVLLVKYYAVDPAMSKVNLLNRVLSVTVRAIQKDADEKKTSFQPRPYFRLFFTWLMDFNAPDPSLDSSNFQVLVAFANAFYQLQPLKVPSWSFVWLELISHRMFMPKQLLSHSQKGWPLFQRLLVALFKFMDPYLRNAELSDPVRLLYKGTLRVLLVLLHDFPEFLCDYHFSFCDVIPPSCIQMRNLILSAFPRNMRLPDPFTPNLKVDLLPEISQAPRILSDVEFALKSKQLKGDVDEYLKTRQSLSLFLVDLKQRLLLPQHEAVTSGTRYNVPLINSLVLYVGMQAIQQLQSKTTPQQLAVPTAPITHSAPMDIFQKLIVELDTEGRYLFLNAIANQLRYPNNHTHYFSCVLLYLFAEANQEIIQEQITRVLLERLIVNRPHPWGLLITFIELIKNPRYSFWSHGFTRCAPEIERLFDSVARSCMGPPIKPTEDELPAGLSSETIKG